MSSLSAHLHPPPFCPSSNRVTSSCKPPRSNRGVRLLGSLSAGSSGAWSRATWPNDPKFDSLSRDFFLSFLLHVRCMRCQLRVRLAVSRLVSSALASPGQVALNPRGNGGSASATALTNWFHAVSGAIDAIKKSRGLFCLSKLQAATQQPAIKSPKQLPMAQCICNTLFPVSAMGRTTPSTPQRPPSAQPMADPWFGPRPSPHHIPAPIPEASQHPSIPASRHPSAPQPSTPPSLPSTPAPVPTRIH